MHGPAATQANFHVHSRFARSTIPEEEWGTTRSLDDSDGNENVNFFFKSNGFFGTFFLPPLHDQDVKFPYATFFAGRKHTKKNVSFSLYNWVCSPRIQLQENLACVAG